MSKIEISEKLSGFISAVGTLSGTLNCKGSLSGKVSMSEVVSIYDGDYEIVPNIKNVQVLPTANKKLKENIIVTAIPYSETSNISNGITVYIGKEIKVNGY